MKLSSYIEQIRGMADCRVLPAGGHPVVRHERHCFPDGVSEFYGCCGGLDMFVEKEFGFRILRPDEVVPANPILLGNDYVKNALVYDADISSAWYLIAKGINSNQVITMDFSKERSGWCYDSFWDVYATGNSSIVAKSFLELIDNLLSARGEILFWEKEGFNLGFAYG